MNPFGITDAGLASIPTLADIDQDGDLDLFVGQTYGDVIYQENLGTALDPAFGESQTNPFGLTNVGLENSSSPTLVDIDRDGDLDLFAGRLDGNVIYQENQGTAKNFTFGTRQTNPFGVTDVGYDSNPTFADIDQDGDLDIFVGERNGNVIYQENLENQKSVEDFGTPQWNLFRLTDVGYNSNPTFVDIDGDGDLDIFVVEELNGNVIYQENQGTAKDPTFGAPQRNPFGLTDAGYNSNPTFVDIDQDGDLDIFVGNYLGNVIYQENQGTAKNPTFGAPQRNPFGVTDAGYDSNPTFADIDQDRDLYLFVRNYNGDVIYQENQGTAKNPTFGAPQTNPFGVANVGYFSSPTFADIDRDGDLDIFVGESDGNVIYQENQGTALAPTFGTPQMNPFGLTDVGLDSSPTLVDIDRDGDLDIFVGETYGNVIYQENQGTALDRTFGTPEANPFGVANVESFSSPTLVDIDRDGDLDIFVGEGNGNVIYQENLENQKIVHPTIVTVEDPITGTPGPGRIGPSNDITNWGITDFEDSIDKIDSHSASITSPEELFYRNSITSSGIDIGNGNVTIPAQTGNTWDSNQHDILISGDNLTGNQMFLDLRDLIFAQCLRLFSQGPLLHSPILSVGLTSETQPLACGEYNC